MITLNQWLLLFSIPPVAFSLGVSASLAWGLIGLLIGIAISMIALFILSIGKNHE